MQGDLDEFLAARGRAEKDNVRVFISNSEDDSLVKSMISESEMTNHTLSSSARLRAARNSSSYPAY